MQIENDIQTLTGTWRLIGAGRVRVQCQRHTKRSSCSLWRAGEFEARSYDVTLMGSFRSKWSSMAPDSGCGSSRRCPFPETRRSCHGSCCRRLWMRSRAIGSGRLESVWNPGSG